MISWLNGFRQLRNFFAIRVITVPSIVARKNSQKGLPMAKLENETPAPALQTSPWEQNKIVLRKKLADLDAYHFSLPESEQALRESIWQDGRNEVLVLLADIRRKEEEGGFETDDDIPDVAPVRKAKPVENPPTASPGKPVDPDSPVRPTRHV